MSGIEGTEAKFKGNSTQNSLKLRVFKYFYPYSSKMSALHTCMHPDLVYRSKFTIRIFEHRH